MSRDIPTPKTDKERMCNMEKIMVIMMILAAYGMVTLPIAMCLAKWKSLHEKKYGRLK